MEGQDIGLSDKALAGLLVLAALGVGAFVVWKLYERSKTEAQVAQTINVPIMLRATPQKQ